MDEYCCAALKQVVENWDGPFYRPIIVNQGTFNLSANRLGIQLYNLTPSKKGISTQGKTTLFLTYCPCCGKKLVGDE